MKRAISSRSKLTAVGFTLVELLVYMAIMGILFSLFYAVFDVNMRTARVQTQVAEMQQNLRVARQDIVRFTRMAGRGGLPISFAPGAMLPNGVALQVANNVTGAAATVGGFPVVPGTDILTVRGVLFNPIYQIDADSQAFAGGNLQVNLLNPLGTPQDLTALAEAIDRINSGTGEPEAMIAVSPLGNRLYSPFQIDGGTVSTVTIGAEDKNTGVSLNFSFDPKYAPLIAGGAQPAQMRSVAFVGVLEEYRYFVRAANAVPGDTSTTLIPRLARVRFYPGTNIVHPSFVAGGNVISEDIADHILDFQVALGIDSNNNGTVSEGPNPASDEWLFNNAGDTLDNPGCAPCQWNGPNQPLRFVRINLLATTSRQDRKHRSPAIAAIEDNLYSEPDIPANQTDKEARMFRRRLTQSVIDLRNF